MSNILVTLADFPAWAIYAGAGAIAGVAGGLLGGLFAKNGAAWAPKLLPVIAIVASTTISREMLIPAVLEAKLNENLPMQVDEVTTLNSAHFTPGGLTSTYTLHADLPADFDVSPIKIASLAGMCDAFKSDFSSRRATRIAYEYKWSGGSGAFTLTPQDCGL